MRRFVARALVSMCPILLALGSPVVAGSSSDTKLVNHVPHARDLEGWNKLMDACKRREEAGDYPGAIALCEQLAAEAAGHFMEVWARVRLHDSYSRTGRPCDARQNIERVLESLNNRNVRRELVGWRMEPDSVAEWASRKRAEIPPC